MNVVIYPREVYCRNRYVTALTNEILYEECDLHTSALYLTIRFGNSDKHHLRWFEYGFVRS